MNANTRHFALALVLLAEALVPYSFGRDAEPFGPPGSRIAFILDSAWVVLLVWSVTTDLPRFEGSGKWRRQRPWLLALAGAVAATLLDWILWPTVTYGSSPVVKVHHVALVHAALAVGVPAFVVLTSRAVGKPVDVARTPLRRWLSAVALVILVVPPFMQFAKLGALIMVIVLPWMKWVRELPFRETELGVSPWRVRIVTFARAALAFVVGQVVVWWLYDGGSFHGEGQNAPPPAFGIVRGAVGLAGWVVWSALGLMFVVLCVSVADSLARAMRNSSVRARMLMLGLSCAGFALVLRLVNIDDAPLVFPPGFKPEVRRILELALLGVAVYIFSVTTSRGLSHSLEQSVRAMSEIGRGNLDVTLDDSGGDEVAAVARSVNRMVAQLREAEFLERINADLRSRSTRLAQTLESLKNAQADLVRSERMASVATLVKGIAHELNNPVNYIAGNIAPLQRYCEFLTRVATELADGRARTAEEVRALTHLTDRKDFGFVTEDLARLTADIGEGARRAQLIISDLQSLTSAAQRGIERIDLHRIVRQTIALLQPRVPPGVNIEVQLSPVSTLPARAGQLEQVLVNLTDNALRAVAERGTVRIAVGRHEDHAVVKVIDDGPGMTAEVKGQAFEPFFTTRAAGEGSGLGLPIVASIVRAHGGTVTIKSEPGGGTEVELRLPLEADWFGAVELSVASG